MTAPSRVSHSIPPMSTGERGREGIPHLVPDDGHLSSELPTRRGLAVCRGAI